MMHHEHFPHVRLFEDTMTISSMTIMAWSDSVITLRHTCPQITRFTLCVLRAKKNLEQHAENIFAAISPCKVLQNIGTSQCQSMKWSDLIPSLSLHDV